jgi:hypothetical protein
MEAYIQETCQKQLCKNQIPFSFPSVQSLSRSCERMNLDGIACKETTLNGILLFLRTLNVAARTLPKIGRSYAVFLSPHYVMPRPHHLLASALPCYSAVENSLSVPHTDRHPRIELIEHMARRKRKSSSSGHGRPPVAPEERNVAQSAALPEDTAALRSHLVIYDHVQISRRTFALSVARLALATLPLAAAVLHSTPAATPAVTRAAFEALLRRLTPGRWKRHQRGFLGTDQAAAAARQQELTDRRLLLSALSQLAMVMWPLVLLALVSALDRRQSEQQKREEAGRRRAGSRATVQVQQQRSQRQQRQQQQQQQAQQQRGSVEKERATGAAGGGFRYSLLVLRAAAVAQAVAAVSALLCGALQGASPGCRLAHAAVQCHSLLLLQAVMMAALFVGQKRVGGVGPISGVCIPYLLNITANN